MAASAAARFSAFAGRTTLASLWAQDAWRFAPRWKAVLGVRGEHWQAERRQPVERDDDRCGFAPRSESYVSPKAALAWQASEAWLLQTSLGRAVRMPTVSELYQGSISANAIVNNDPNLKPEKSWTAELTAERDLAQRQRCARRFFYEDTKDALYSQTNVTAGGTVATIQNVDRIRTAGSRSPRPANDVLVKGLSLNGSLTYADSKITQNDKFPASVGKWQPRVPRWRAALLATYASTSAGRAPSACATPASSSASSTTPTPTASPSPASASSSSSTCARSTRSRQSWAISAGIDNLNNYHYWAFHPYPQRTYHAELRFDL